MLNGYKEGDLIGSGAVVWKAREMYAAGDLDKDQLLDYISKGYE